MRVDQLRKFSSVSEPSINIDDLALQLLRLLIASLLLNHIYQHSENAGRVCMELA